MLNNFESVLKLYVIMANCSMLIILIFASKSSVNYVIVILNRVFELSFIKD